jgi:segregation and condensation protein B
MSVIDYSWDFTREEFSLDLDFFNEKEQEDKLWQARTGLNHETLCGAIETIIFMSDRPITLQKIKAYIDSDIPLRVIHESIARLQEEYELKHHGIRLMEVASGYQFRTKATYSKIIQNMFKVASMQLSPTALEVMAIIAYKQPISKTTVESIRGVDSSHIVRQLMDKRLVKIVGRSEEMGRPSLYGTTNEFLEVFNLASLDDLPSESELHELATASDIGAISDIKSIVANPDKKVFDFDEFDELEELSTQIQTISAETSFTETLKSFDRKRTSEDGAERKSAFDILEDFVNSVQIIEQNKEALLSETLMSVMDPKSVDVTSTEELFNAPALDDEDMIVDLELEDRELPEYELILEEDFDDSEFMSLDTDADDLLEKSEMLLQEMANDEAGESLEEVLEDQPQLNAAELADALDEAFDKLMGPSFDDEEEMSADEVDQAHADFIEEGMDQLDDQKNLAINKAKDLDLDLDFFNQED